MIDIRDIADARGVRAAAEAALDAPGGCAAEGQAAARLDLAQANAWIAARTPRQPAPEAIRAEAIEAARYERLWTTRALDVVVRDVPPELYAAMRLRLAGANARLARLFAEAKL